jgi:hypothetical protein
MSKIAEKEIRLKDGEVVITRTALPADGAQILGLFMLYLRKKSSR